MAHVDRTHYAVLGLPSQSLEYPPTPQQLKAAYRRALLQHHPDKSRAPHANGVQAVDRAVTVQYSVDRVLFAYNILSDPKARAEYDRELRLRPTSSAKAGGEDGGHQQSYSGLDTIDLDDLDYDDSKNVWFRGCRCGDTRGFLVTEEELGNAEKEGIVAVGCRGCSLWLMVLFQAASDDMDSGHTGGDG